MPTDIEQLRRHNRQRAARIVDTSTPLALDDLDWGEVGDHALDADVVDILVYMRDVEGFTDRDPVGLSAHKTTLADPLVARFLATWRADEANHTRALVRFLDHYTAARPVAVPSRQLPPPSVAPRRERLLARVGGPIGGIVTAAHMTWAAANELLTMNGYRQLAKRCDHPILAVVLERIAAQEARHFSFYALEAEWRLASSRAAQRVLVHMLRRAWTPVGVGDGYKSPAEFGRVLAYLGAGEDGRRSIERMDRRIASLPGFEDLRIFERTWSELTPAA